MAIQISGTTVIDDSRGGDNLAGFYSTYSQLGLKLNQIASPGSSITVDMTQSYTSIVMNASASVTASNILSGRTHTVILASFSPLKP